VLKDVVRRPFHGVGLAGAGLTVSKDGAVVALKDLLDQRSDHALVDIRLEKKISVHDK
jgi:hypothetical protein